MNFFEKLNLNMFHLMVQLILIIIIPLQLINIIFMIIIHEKENIKKLKLIQPHHPMMPIVNILKKIIFYFFVFVEDHLSSNKQSSTSSYISDDCKVLYIETVIEVAKPVFYERTNDTVTTTNREYHHQHPQSIINTEYHHHHQLPQSTHNTDYHQNSQSTLNTDYHRIPQSNLNTDYHQNSQTTHNTEYHQIPQSTIHTQRSTNHFYKNQKHIHESSDDDSNKPVNSTTSSLSKTQFDSGIEYDQTSQPTSTSSTSTIYNKVLIPSTSPITSIFDDSSETKLTHRSQITKIPTINKYKNIELNSSAISYWDRLKQIWLRSLLLGLLILFILFFVYFSRLDTCTRSTIIRTVFRKIICIEDEGLPTI